MAAAQQHLRAVRLRALDEPVDPLEVLARDLRPDVGGLLARVSLADHAGRLEEPLEERVAHRSLDDQPRPGQAHLPGVVELVHRLLHGRIQIGVGERDERRLAPELQRDGREVRRRGLRDELAGLDRPGERDPADAGVARERGAGLLADPLHHVERAVGHPASRAMSANRDAVRGAHSGGLATTLLPAASAGAMRHVASISGAFHGVITIVTPDGSHSVRLTNSFISNASSPSSVSWSAKKRKFRATRGMTEFRCERRSEPLSRVSTVASSGTRSSTSSAIRCRTWPGRPPRSAPTCRTRSGPPSRPGRPRPSRPERPRRSPPRRSERRRGRPPTSPPAHRRSSARSRPRRPRSRRSRPWGLLSSGKVVRFRTIGTHSLDCQGGAWR